MPLAFKGKRKWVELFDPYAFELSIASLCVGATCIGLTVGMPEMTVKYHVDPNSLNGTLYSKDVKMMTKLVLNLGACLGALLPPCLVDTFGRRHNFAISASIDILFWTSLFFSRTFVRYMLSTAIGGLATGSFIVTATLYISEVSPSKNRGSVGSLVAFFAYLGILVGTSLSLFVHNRIAPLMICLLACTFFITIYFWMIESPYFLYDKGKTLEAKLVLKVLRNASHIFDIDLEYKTIENFYDFKNKSEKTYSSNILRLAIVELKNRSWMTAMIFILVISQMLGTYALGKYTENFIEEIIPDFGEILMTFLDIISLGLLVFLIEKIGKKPFMVLSITGLSLSCLILAIDTLIHKIIYENHSYEYEEIVTIFIVILYCLAYSLGLTPILPIFTSDIFPNHLKTIAISFCVSMLYLSAIINQSIFEILNAQSGTYVAITAFTIIGSLGLFFFYYIFRSSTVAIGFHEILNRIEGLPIFM